jgi:hypothetical protein
MSVKPKIVYVLVSDSTDHYTEMAILSVYCARKYSPSCSIELVVDIKTKSGLKGHRAKLLDLVDIVTEVDVAGENNAFTSRLIKTQLRKFVNGDYLYVDIDAVPVADLSSVFMLDTDLAMAHDHNVPPEKFFFYDYERDIFDKTGWPLPERYFNSGVMLVKDTPKVREFFDCWQGLWQENRKLGLHKDQPPMHEAIRLLDMKVHALGPEWNLLVGLQKGYGGKNPRVYHYSTIQFDTRQDTYFHELVKKLKNTGHIDMVLLENIIITKYPWTNRSSLRLNWAIGNYHLLPWLIMKKIAFKVIR